MHSSEAIAILCADQGDDGPEQMMFCNDDFPAHYVDFAHPTDYVPSATPIEPEYILSERRGRHNRLLFRVSWHVPGCFVPLTFVIDTGSPKHLYLSERAMTMLEARGIVHWDVDLDQSWVWLFGRRCAVDRTPRCHDPANIIGLKLLMRMGLALHLPGGERPFSFCTDVSVLHRGAPPPLQPPFAS